MNPNPRMEGPSVQPDQLVDVYLAGKDSPSPWVAITDQVMGGISSAELEHGERHGSPCTCLSGRTSLENNGGFIQMKLEVESSWSCADYAGLFIELCGAAHDYNLNVKTTQLDKPWQSFRSTLAVEPQWTRFVVPYAQLRPHRSNLKLDPATVRSVAVVAIGSAFDVDVCVRRFGFFVGR